VRRNDEMTKHERISRDLQRLRDTRKLILDDPEVWRLEIETLPNGRYEITIDHRDELDTDYIIASWSAVINEVTSFYAALEALECL